jgi:hypothetical protein
MASADVVPAGREWAWSSPWRWLLVAALASGLAFLHARLLGAAAPAVRAVLLLSGLLAAAGAVCLRFQVGGTPIERWPVAQRSKAVLALAAVNAVLAIAATVLLVAALLGVGGLPWTTGSVVFFWLVTAPWCAWLALYFLRHADGKEPVSERVEGAAVLVLAALSAFLACWALYLGPEHAWEWDSIRLLLAMVALLSFVASAIVAAPQWLRRLAVSALIVLHFGGIFIAVTSSEPGPWLSQLLWVRVYHPYLEFMRLNNAYRFYSPEPFPATQLWFVVEYKDHEADTIRWHLERLPKVDAEGEPLYPLRLQYQRRLSLTENVARVMPTTTTEYIDLKDDRRRLAPYLRKRDVLSPYPLLPKDALGQEQPKSKLIIPYHPTTTRPQYAVPNPNSKLLLQSYARHVCRMPHPKYPKATVVSVRIYRVLHETLTPQELAAGADPQDLFYFLPYYQGQYSPEGYLMDPADPFLYWLLPTLRGDWTDPRFPLAHGADDPTRSVFALKHAGDTDSWIVRPAPAPPKKPQ